MATALLTRRSQTFARRLLHPTSPASLSLLHSAVSHGGATAPPDPRSGSPRFVPSAGLPRSFSAGVRRSILSSGTISGYGHISRCHGYELPLVSMEDSARFFSGKAQEGSVKQENMSMKPSFSDVEEGKSSPVLAFSPLEGVRSSGLRSESLKIRRMELSQKLTYALIPVLLVVSKTKLTTSLLLMAVYWQIYGFFKEIFLDYVHQEVTRKWVLIYFSLLLIILAKETFLTFNMV